MGKITSIGWADITWNIAVGCHKVDADCKICYMYRDSLKGTRYNPRQVRKTKTVFDLPNRITQTKSNVRIGDPLVFTSSLTDFALEEIDEYRAEIWAMIRKNKHLTFIILTKRPERLISILPSDWGDGWDNVWLGTSVGGNQGLHRIVSISKVPAKVRLVSFEPLWEDLDLKNTDLSAIDWAIIGGESGNINGSYRARPCSLSWIENVIQALPSNCAVFVKQLGTTLAKELKLRHRHGADPSEWPEHLRLCNFPA